MTGGWIKNYITVAFRNLSRHWVHSLITISGLAVGMACCILITLYVRYELSYDDYHVNVGRIYRVGSEISFGDQRDLTARTPHPLSPALIDEIPEVESAVRFRKDSPVISRKDVLSRESRFYYTDPSVFSVFSFPLAEGDPATALVEPFSIVVTEDAASRYFGGQDPVGDMLMVGGSLMKVTGVMKNIPENSHFVFDFLASYSTLQSIDPQQWAAWDNIVTSTYILLDKGADRDVVEAKFSEFRSRHFDASTGVNRLLLTPLRELHLGGRLPGDLGSGGNETALAVFSGVALFILLIACINFVNLFVARASHRAREVGVRKAFGALRRNLVVQFLLESILLVLMSLVLALAAVEFILPGLNALAEEQIRPPGAGLLMIIVAVALGLGFAAGLYPALFMSAFKPALVPDQMVAGAGRPRFQSLLVVAQFVISASFIASSLIVAQQLDFVRTIDLGFDKEHVVIIPLNDSEARRKIAALKESLLRYPGVVNASATYNTPTRGLAEYEVRIDGGRKGEVIATYIVDDDFLPTYGITLAEGRNFSTDFPSDASSAFLINESAARMFQWKEPIGKRVTWDSHKRGTIIGVVGDFHVRSLHEPVSPLLIHVDPDYYRYLSVRVRGGQMTGFLGFLKDEWRTVAPNDPLEYSFLEQDFANQYRADERFAKIMDYAAYLGMLIACLGLVALASIAVTHRSREVGIRKVLGASATGVTRLLSYDFLKLVAVANLAAVPLVWIAMNRWLDQFAYRVQFGVDVFLTTAIISFLASAVSIVALVIRAATMNPVTTLRHE